MSGCRRTRSEIWTFFTQDKSATSQIATCNICKNQFSYKTSTTNLKRHMMSRHPTVNMKFAVTDSRHHLTSTSSFNRGEQQENMEQDGTPREKETSTSFPNNQSQPKPSTSSETTQSITLENTTVTNTILYPRQMAISSYIPKKIPISTKKKIDDKLLQLFTKDFQPFSVVEDKGFKEFIKELNPSYEMPCRKHISNTLIPAKFEECLHTTKAMLSTAVKVCLTTDTWTSVNTDSFMAVTAHFVDEDFTLVSVKCAMQCAQFSGRHTSGNLANELRKVELEWNLQNKISITISDNAKNITKAVKDILKWKHFGCFAHSLNLIVNDSFEKNEVISNLLRNIRGVVGHFKRSTTSNEKLMAYQTKNMPDRAQLKLIQDVSTRWNSTYYMLERFTFLEETVKATVALLEQNVTQLTNEDWRMAHELVKVLKPFETVTKHVSAEKYATASLVIPLALGLKDVCNKLLQRNFSPAVKEVVKALAKGVDDRFGDYERSKTLSISTFLDPRYKNCIFSEETTRDEVKKTAIALVASKIEQHNSNTSTNGRNENQSSESVDQDEDLSVFNYVKQCVSKHKPSGTKQSRAIIEVNRYLDEEILPKNCDPLRWWQDNKIDYPFLSKVVRDFFCVLCTSVPCERVFSKSGYMLNDRRNRLTGKKAKQIMFLNCNGY